jgi:hypothetical protein
MSYLKGKNLNPFYDGWYTRHFAIRDEMIRNSKAFHYTHATKYNL